MSDWNLAFPLAVTYASGAVETHNGLTKRELFAAMAMQGLVANTDFAKNLPPWSIAKAAVEYSDELIEQLEKRK